MPRRKITNAERHAFAVERGKLEAELAIKKKTHKIEFENLLLSAREHVGKLIDTMTFEDVVDVVSAAGLTVVIHEALKLIPSITTTLKTLTFTELGSVLGSIIFPGIGTSIGALVGIIFADLFKQYITPIPKPEEKEPKEKTTEEQIQVFMSWLLAFAIAWCIVKWGGQIVGAGIGNLAGIIALLGI